MTRPSRRHGVAALLATALLVPMISSCTWRGLNTLRLPGTAGNDANALVVQAEMPDVNNLQPNSPVQVADVTVGSVTKIERQDWHAVVTMRLNRDVDLPANSTITLAQTSLLATLHLELAPPVAVPAQGRLRTGSVIPLSAAGAYPDTEQTLAMLSMLLNGGGIGQLQDITEAFSTAFAGREGDLRSLLEQLNRFVRSLNEQKDDIVAATESFNSLIGKFAQQKPVLDK